MLISAVLMVAALSGADPDGVVATAPATTVDLEATARPTAPSVGGAAQAAVPHGLSTDQQIDRWIESRSVADKPWSEAGPDLLDDRKMHGEAEFSIGTGGYRGYGAAVSLPIGETGRLDLSYRRVENGYRYGGYGYGYPSFDIGGHGVPGHRSGAATEFGGGVLWQGGPPHPRRDPGVWPAR